MAHDRPADPEPERERDLIPTTPERERERFEERKPLLIERAREIVLDDDGEVIAPEALDDALREHGIEIGTSPDGYQELRNAEDLPTALIHMAVDTQQDPADVLDSEDTETS